MSRIPPAFTLTCLGLLMQGCVGAVAAPPALAPAPTAVRVSPQIISKDAAASERELFEWGQRALLEQHWREAADAFEMLLAASRVSGEQYGKYGDAYGSPGGPELSTILFDLGVAYEGLGEREAARDRYHELARRFPESAQARAALVRVVVLHAYLEEWTSLGETANALLARKDLNDVDRLTALGARGLARVEAGDDAAAMRDVQQGLDIVEELHYGAENRLPVGAAQLRFALAEVRRVRSERIGFLPVTPDFLVKIEMRCQGLLDAQNAYADAIRSVDPHWAAMSGYRIGEMYRVLHRDLMEIPPTDAAKTEPQKQLFFAMMHVRYRALLDKGIEMMRRTIALADKVNDASSWATRARAAQAEMEIALADEKATLAKFPYTEAEVEKALGILQKKAEAKAAP
jgi:tetratricopeptide (TPR) repeat protein